MEKETKKRSWKEVLRLHWRGVKVLHETSPHFFISQISNEVIGALTPYVTIWLSARIINELAGLRRVEELRYWVILTLVTEILLGLLRYGLNQWAAALDKITSVREDLGPYVKKLFTMDFADVDNQENKEKLATITASQNYAGLGFYTLRIAVCKLVSNTAGALGALALTVSLFTTPVSQGSPLSFLNSPLFLAAVLGVILLVTLVSGYLNGRQNSLFLNMNDEGNLGNNFFSAFAFIGTRRKASVDMRLYHQVKVVRHYMRENKTFSYGGPYEKKVVKPGSWYGGFSASLSAVLTGFVYLFTCLKAWAGAFGVGYVTQYVSAVTALSRNISSLLSIPGELQGNADTMELIFSFLDIPHSMYQGSLTTEKRSDRQYEVEFRDVSFQYPNTETWALRHVNMKFQVGQRLAVVGENGSGKTTFIKLLCRLYDPTEGQILLNGIDIRKYDYRDYMNIFSVVFQDFQLIAQPLGNNVAGAMEYDRERAEKALVDAGFGDRLVEMPKGLDTYLYKDLDKEGVEVSGGEAQKIAIARALYKDAPFIILDEPTAALDPLAEAEIYAKFDQIAGDRTAVYISHRLSSCKFCDEIAVFDHGAVVQQGGHEELLSNENGKYHALWHAQAQYYAQEGMEAAALPLPERSLAEGQ